MRRILITLTAIAGMTGGLIAPAAAQDAIGRAFAETFFAEEEISDSVKELPDVSWLEKSDMNQLLQTKQVLSAFFQALKPGESADVRSFLSPDLASTYNNRTALRRDRFGAETYLGFEVIDFRIAKEHDGIKLRYFLSESDRGRASIRQRAVTFEKFAGRWLITEFDNFEFN